MEIDKEFALHALQWMKTKVEGTFACKVTFPLRLKAAEREALGRILISEAEIMFGSSSANGGATFNLSLSDLRKLETCKKNNPPKEPESLDFCAVLIAGRSRLKSKLAPGGTELEKGLMDARRR